MTVLHNLQERFINSQAIYTYCGKHLFPFELLREGLYELAKYLWLLFGYAIIIPALCCILIECCICSFSAITWIVAMIIRTMSHSDQSPNQYESFESINFVDACH